MKLIVSSKTAFIIVEKAIKSNCKTFKIEVETGIIFDTVDMPLYAEMKKYLSSDETFQFNTLKWVRVMNFLKGLEEQPIEMEIDGNESDCSIELAGFIKRF